MEHVTYEIKQDDLYESPRDWDNFGTMVCQHRRHKLGDTQEYYEPSELDLVLPLYLYDHSGLTMRVTPFSCSFDSGQVGIIYATKEQIDKEFDGDYDRARACLESEVEVYDQYLTGDVWGYVIEDQDGNHLDSCWGFYGHEYCEQEAKNMATYHNQEQAAENCNSFGLMSMA